jgi:hypothetical protein
VALTAGGGLVRPGARTLSRNIVSAYRETLHPPASLKDRYCLFIVEGSKNQRLSFSVFFGNELELAIGYPASNTHALRPSKPTRSHIGPANHPRGRKSSSPAEPATSHTCKALAAAGHPPGVLDNLSTGHRWAVKWGPLIVGDVADPAAGRWPRGALSTIRLQERAFWLSRVQVAVPTSRLSCRRP